MSALHVQVVEAGRAHRQSDSCPCGPRLDIIEEADGQLAWAFLHNTLPDAVVPFNGYFNAGSTAARTITINGNFTPDMANAFQVAYGTDLRKGDGLL